MHGMHGRANSQVDMQARSLLRQSQIRVIVLLEDLRGVPLDVHQGLVICMHFDWAAYA